MMKEFLVIFTVLFALTLHGTKATNTTRLKCYECSSFDDIRCGDPFEAKETIRECPRWGDMEANLCRKLRQMIDTPQGKQIRVTRSCGYLKNHNPGRDEHCFKASFTASSSSRYCACENDGCNTGNSIAKFSTLLKIMTVIYAVFKMI